MADLAVTDSELELDGQPVRLHRAGDDDVPVLYLHDVPSDGRDWTPLLARTGGIAPDLPGFGRSGKRGDLDYSPAGYARWLGGLLDLLGVERVRLCAHGWGATGLIWAIEHPERVERIVLVGPVPLLAGQRWHPWARAWRAPMVGEIAVGLMTGPVVRRMLRRTSAPDSPVPRMLAGRIVEQFDQGSQRAILRLHRAAAPAHLAEFGDGLGELTAPALVLGGAHDRWFAPELTAAYATALGDGTYERLPDAGHWAWLEDPAAADRIVAFLDGRAPVAS